MHGGFIVIPLADNTLTPLRCAPLVYSEQAIRSAFNNTPALGKILAAPHRVVRMELAALVASGLPMA